MIFIDGITTIGAGVFVEPEIHLRNVVVLPFKNVSDSAFHQIIVWRGNTLLKTILSIKVNLIILLLIINKILTILKNA